MEVRVQLSVPQRTIYLRVQDSLITHNVFSYSLSSQNFQRFFLFLFVLWENHEWRLIFPRSWRIRYTEEMVGRTTLGLRLSSPCSVKGTSEPPSSLSRRMVSLFLATLILPRLLTFSKVKFSSSSYLLLDFLYLYLFTCVFFFFTLGLFICVISIRRWWSWWIFRFISLILVVILMFNFQYSHCS